MGDESPYILYGSFASYAAAKSRSTLRKKGIRFFERLPASEAIPSRGRGFSSPRNFSRNALGLLMKF